MAIDHVLPHSLDEYGVGLDVFLAKYDADDNIWWTISDGHKQDLFECLKDDYEMAVQLLRNLVDNLTEIQVAEDAYIPNDDPLVQQAAKWLSQR